LNRLQGLCVFERSFQFKSNQGDARGEGLVSRKKAAR